MVDFGIGNPFFSSLLEVVDEFFTLPDNRAIRVMDAVVYAKKRLSGVKPEELQKFRDQIWQAAQ